MALKINRQLVSDIGRVVLLAILFTSAALILERPGIRDYLFDIKTMRETLKGGSDTFHFIVSAFMFVLLGGGLIAAGIPRIWASAVGGVIYGAFMGTILSLAASILGASITYAAGISLLAGVVERRMGGAMNVWRNRFQENGFWWTLYGRLFPFSNSTVMSLLCGSCRVPYRDFMLGSMLGFIPLAIIFATFGSGGIKGSLWQVGLATALLALSMFSRSLLARWFPVNDSNARDL